MFSLSGGLEWVDLRDINGISEQDVWLYVHT